MRQPNSRATLSTKLIVGAVRRLAGQFIGFIEPLGVRSDENRPTVVLEPVESSSGKLTTSLPIAVGLPPAPRVRPDRPELRDHDREATSERLARRAANGDTFDSSPGITQGSWHPSTAFVAPGCTQLQIDRDRGHLAMPPLPRHRHTGPYHGGSTGLS
jgi:hypothetical protein